MNQELVSEITKTLMDSRGFVEAQAPEVVRQYLSFQITSNLGWAFLSAAFFYIAIRGIKAGRGQEWIDSPQTPLSYILAAVCSVVFVCAVVTAMQIQTFPKGYLMEQVLCAHCHK